MINRRHTLGLLLFLIAFAAYLLWKAWFVFALPFLYYALSIYHYTKTGKTRTFSAQDLIPLVMDGKLAGVSTRAWQELPVTARYLTLKGLLVDTLADGSDSVAFTTILGSTPRIIETPTLVELRRLARSYSLNYELAQPSGFSTYDYALETNGRRISEKPVAHIDVVGSAPDSDDQTHPGFKKRYADWLGRRRRCFVGCTAGLLNENPLLSFSGLPGESGGFSEEALIQDLMTDGSWRLVKGVPVPGVGAEEIQDWSSLPSEVPFDVAQIPALNFGQPMESRGMFFWRMARSGDFLETSTPFSVWHGREIEGIKAKLAVTYPDDYRYWNLRDNSVRGRWLRYLLSMAPEGPLAIMIADKLTSWRLDEASIMMIPRLLRVKCLVLTNSTSAPMNVGHFGVVENHEPGIKHVNLIDRDKHEQVQSQIPFLNKRHYVAAGSIQPGETILLPMALELAFDGPLFGFYEAISLSPDPSSNSIVVDPASDKVELWHDSAKDAWYETRGIEVTKSTFGTLSSREGTFQEVTALRPLHLGPFLDILTVQVNGETFLVRSSIAEALEQHGLYCWQG